MKKKSKRHRHWFPEAWKHCLICREARGLPVPGKVKQ